MERKTRLIFLSKLLGVLKFYNDETHTEYREVIFSPFRKEFEEEVRKELWESLGLSLENPSFRPKLRSDSEHFARFLKLVSVIPESRLSEEQKIEMINILVYPYTLTAEQQYNLLSEFGSCSSVY